MPTVITPQYPCLKTKQDDGGGGSIRDGNYAPKWVNSGRTSTGRRTQTVDAAGYLTQVTYTEMGEVQSTTEFARALVTGSWSLAAAPGNPVAGDASIGYDRTTAYAYDALGRKISETTIRHYHTAVGSLAVRSVVTGSEYDAAGNMTANVVDGQRTETKFDALGRAMSVTESERQVLASNWQSLLLNANLNLASSGLYVNASPYTELAYDSFGNTVRVIRSVNGKQNGSVTFDAANDQVTLTRYDRQGRAVMDRDAEGIERYREYDAADNITKVWSRLSSGSGTTWRIVTDVSYDASGRQITTLSTRQVEVNGVLQAGTVQTEQSVQARYNAFGEVIAKGNTLDLNAVTSDLQEQYQYDAAGRIIHTNAQTGAYHDYFYNLAGQQITEARIVYTNGPSSTPIYVSNQVDVLGRITRQSLPANTATSTINYLHKAYDRWGNVVEQIDPRGNLTRLEYNELNQAVRETQPMVKVSSETGVETWVRPEQRWFYDALGRMVGMQDANGNIRKQNFDAANRQTISYDAYGNATRVAFDALGRQRAKQDALGYITYDQFDRLNRATAQGDFLLNTAGTGRTQQARQSFGLNQNGDRILVTDALSNTQRYDFDGQQHLLRSQTAENVVMQYGYDVNGNKIFERTGLYNAGTTATVDRDGDSVREDEQTWKYDYFGHVRDYNDLGKNDFNYNYDEASGQLINFNSTTIASSSLGYNWGAMEQLLFQMQYLTDQTQNRSQTYFENGQIKQIVDANGAIYTYEYDANGNRTMEETKTIDGRGTAVQVRMRLYYDSHNRIERVTADDVLNNARKMEIRYGYDAVGNRRYAWATSGYSGTGATVAIPTTGSAPVLASTISNITVRPGVAQSFVFQATELFFDVDHDELSYSVELAGGGALPSWIQARYDATSRSIIFDTTSGSSVASGTTLQLQIKAQSGSDVVTNVFTVLVASNTAPVVINPNEVPTLYIGTGEQWESSLNANQLFSDADLGDHLSIAGFDLVRLGADGGAITANPAWLQSAVSDNLLFLNGLASTLDAGTYLMFVRGIDSSGAQVERMIKLVVEVPTAPVANAAITTNVYQQTGFVFQQTLAQLFTSPVSGGLTLRAEMANGSTLPSWVTLEYDQNDPQHPIVRLTGDLPETIAANQTITVRVIATNRFGQSSSVDVAFQVKPKPSAYTLSPTFINRTINWTVGQNSRFVLPADAFISTNGSPIITRMEGGYYQNGGFGNDIVPYASILDFLPPAANELPSWLQYDPSTQTITGSASNYPKPPIIYYDPIFGQPLSPPPPRDYDIKFFIMATDGAGAEAYIACTLHVDVPNSDELPIQVIPFDPPTAVVNQLWSYTLPAGMFVDPEGGALTLGVTPAYGSNATYNAATRTFSGTATAAGVYTHSIYVTDAGGGSTYFIFDQKVNASNQAPVIASPASDLTITQNQAWSYVVPTTWFKDPEGKALSLSAQSMPSWLFFNASTKTFTGTPPTGGGVWSVRLRASDGSAWVDHTFSIIANPANNLAPVVEYKIDTQQVRQGQAWELSIPSYLMRDPDNTAITVSCDMADGSGLPSWLKWDTTNKKFYIQAGGFPLPTVKDYVIRLQGRDQSGAGARAITTFTLKMLGSSAQTPIMVSTPLQNQVATEGQPISFTLPTNAFRDNFGASLVISASVASEAYESIFSVYVGGDETTRPLPSWLNYDPATRIFSGTPPTAGTWTIVVKAEKSGTYYETVTQKFVLKANPAVGNTAPVVNGSVSPQSIAIGNEWVYALPGNLITDANGSNLLFSASLSNGSPLPGWLSFDPATKTFRGTPPATGNWQLRIKAQDPSGTSVTTDMSFSVVAAAANQGPTANQTQLVRTISPGPLHFVLPSGLFSDDQGNRLAYFVESAGGGVLPYWLSFDATNLVLSGSVKQVANPYSVSLQVRVRDNAGIESIIPLTLNYRYQTTQGGGGYNPITGGLRGAEVPVTGTSNTIAAQAFSTADARWFTYDRENRVVLQNGTLVDGAIRTTYIPYDPVNPGQNIGAAENIYDALGRNVAKVSYFYQQDDFSSIQRLSYGVQHMRYDERGNLVTTFSTTPDLNSIKLSASNYSWTTTAFERRNFDAAGRLTEVRQYFEAGTYFSNYSTYNVTVYGGGWLKHVETYQYDHDGRMSSQTSFGRKASNYDTSWNPQPIKGTDWFSIAYTGKLPSETLAEFQYRQTYLPSVLTQLSQTTVTYNAAGQQSGMVLSHTAWEAVAEDEVAKQSSPAGFTHTFTYSYLKRSAYLEQVVNGTSSNSNYKPSHTTSRYDAYGRRIAVIEHAKGSEADTARFFSYNADDGILTRRDGTLSSGTFNQGDGTTTRINNQHFIHANGTQYGHVSGSGNMEFLSTLTAYSSRGEGVGQYLVQNGDTLRTVAQKVYGDSNLWYVLAEANAITDSSASLSAGTILQKPSVASVKNDANSFKPYNPNEIVGSTVPNLPYVPPAPCNPMMIIMVIVAVIVTIYTAGAASGLVGLAAGGGGATTAAIGGAALAGGAVGGTTLIATAGGLAAATSVGFASAVAAGIGAFAGSIASQLVGKALGVVDHFSLRQAVGAGITAGLTAGIGSQLGTTGELLKNANSAASWGKVAASVVGNAAAGYVGNRIAGVKDTSFSWKAIAAGAVTNLATAAIGNGLNKVSFLQNSEVWGEGQLAGNFARNAIGGVVSLHVRRAFGFDDRVDYGSIAADAFGNAIASEMVKREGMQKAAKQERFNQIGQMLTGALGGFALNTEFVADAGAALSEVPMSGVQYALEENGRPDFNRYLDQPADADALINDTRFSFGGASRARFDTDIDGRPKLSLLLPAAPSEEEIASGYEGWMKKNPRLVNAQLEYAQSELTNEPWYDGFFNSDAHKEREIALTTARTQKRLFDAAPKYIPRSTYDYYSDTYNRYQSGDLKMNPEHAIALRDGIRTMNYFYGEGQILMAPPSAAERAYTAETNLRLSNSFGMAVLGPVFGFPAAVTRTFGYNETQVSGGLQFGALLFDTATLAAARPSRPGQFRTRPGAVETARGSPLKPLNAEATLGGTVNKAVNPQDKLPRVNFSAETVRALGSAPKGMMNPHKHHILEVNGRPGEYRSLVREGQVILRSYDIDPLNGVENLVWAPNKGHTVVATKNLVQDLKMAQAEGASRQVIVKILMRHGQNAARR